MTYVSSTCQPCRCMSNLMQNPLMLMMLVLNILLRRFVSDKDRVLLSKGCCVLHHIEFWNFSLSYMRICLLISGVSQDKRFRSGAYISFDTKKLIVVMPEHWARHQRCRSEFLLTSLWKLHAGRDYAIYMFLVRVCSGSKFLVCWGSKNNMVSLLLACFRLLHIDLQNAFSILLCDNAISIHAQVTNRK